MIESGLLTIDLAAIGANYRLLREKAKSAECAAVIKANAYGLGVKEVAKFLAKEGCRHFFVATIGEGVEARSILENAVIHVFNGIPRGAPRGAPRGGGRIFAEYKLTPVLNSLDDIDEWSSLAKKLGKPKGACLHVDTGMSRLGLSSQELNILAADKSRLDGIDIACVISHLACADEPDHEMNRRQLQNFKAALLRLPKCKASLANSAGIFLGSDYHFQMVRPGCALYGVSPLAKEPNPMAKVVRLQAEILQIREIDTKKTVGYGATHEAKPGERVATVSLGYADGYPRSLSGKGYGFIGSYKAPVIGRVSMDLITLDVTEIPSGIAYPGAMVDLIGPENPVDEVARLAGTIGYEILTGLGGRCLRIYAGA